LCGLAVLCLAWLQCAAQRYTFRGYTDGMGNLNITCIAQDHTGYLWVGTQNGVYRYDGSHFQRYGATEGLPERTIENLFVGLDGTLWVGTDNGIYYAQADGRFAEVHSPWPQQQIAQRAGTAFTASRPDQVVAATMTGALLLRKVAADNWTAEPLNLEGGEIFGVLYGPDGGLWYGCETDLCRLDKGKTSRMRTRWGLPEEQWTNLLLARNGHIWLRGSKHVGEILPREGRFELHDPSDTSFNEPYPMLAEDAGGRILTSNRASLDLWEGDHWRMVTAHNGLSNFEIQDLFVDREGSVWLGVVGHGLRRWVGQDRWEAYTQADGLSDDLVWDTVRDHQGRLWIATESGLDWIPAGETDPRPWRQPGISTARSLALEVSPDGAIWMGSAAGSLTRIDPKTLTGTQWKVPLVYILLADGPNQLWLATRRGLYLMDTQSPHQPPRLVDDPGIPQPTSRFTDLSTDRAGRLWAASDLGLLRHDSNGWHQIDAGNSGAKHPDLIAVDHQGYLWAAGPSQDLMRLRISGNRVVEAQHISQPQILSEQVVSLMVDHRGWVWVGQDAGLSVYDGSKWRSFTQDDGLIWNDTDSYGLTEDKDGSMWIGTSGGLSHLINPQAVSTALQLPPVFSQVTYGGKALNNAEHVEWVDSPLVISMASLAFKDSRNIGVRYRLQGDRGAGWEQTSELIARFRHLAPGDYRFEAVSVDALGNALSPVAVFTFRIVPHWWQSNVVQIGLGLLAVLVALAFWRWRVAKFVVQKRQLEQAVRSRTEDLEREKAELVRTREQMRHNAEHDGLTGLWNHRIIVQRLQGEVERSRRDGNSLCVIMADLDYFKKINDTFGHAAGDMVLREISAILHNLVRSYDWVGRYGGEEFLLVLPGSDLKGAIARAEQMRAAIENARIRSGNDTISVSASFGVAAGQPSDYESMIQVADDALYRAKNKGRNCVVAAEINYPLVTASSPRRA
jgi:diguanylate cyclase (GGDEF)-like protein